MDAPSLSLLTPPPELSPKLTFLLLTSREPPSCGEVSDTKSVLTTWKVPSPRKNVVESLVPVPILAIGTVPDAILEPFKLVNEAPEPLNVVAVHTPALPR